MLQYYKNPYLVLEVPCRQELPKKATGEVNPVLPG